MKKTRMVTLRRVVVTGIGMVTPLGDTAQKTWSELIAGKSGIGPLTRFNPDEYKAGPDFPRIAGEVKFDLEGRLAEKGVDRKLIKRTDRFTRLALAAAIEAFQDSGVNLETEDRRRIGVQIGAGLGGAETWEEQCRIFWKEGVERISPFFMPKLIVNMAAGIVSMHFGTLGPNLCTTTACAAGSHSIGGAFEIIRMGKADLMICGGTEAAITPLAFGGFHKMKAMATKWNDQPEKACRPFDKNRDGLVLGEGAGVMILEELGHALRRGAKIYGEVLGFGVSSDAYDQVVPNSLGQENCMRAALEDAGISAKEVGYINAHGTATLIGDIEETKAIKKLLGRRAYQVPVSSTKSMTGHLLGASGAVEAIFTVLALKEGILPPTINLENPDPECDLDYVPGRTRRTKAIIGLSNSFGFGGTNSCLVFKHFEIKEATQ